MDFGQDAVPAAVGDERGPRPSAQPRLEDVEPEAGVAGLPPARAHQHFPPVAEKKELPAKPAIGTVSNVSNVADPSAETFATCSSRIVSLSSTTFFSFNF